MIAPVESLMAPTGRLRASARLGPRRVALVGCCGPKLSSRAPAFELYTSQLFRLARAFAERTCDAWLILSAKHGVVRPENVLEPYDCRLEHLTAEQLAWWHSRVRHELATQFPGATFVLLAGEAYAAGLAGLTVERPLRGLGIGQRIAWFARQLEGRAPAVAKAARWRSCLACRGRCFEPGTSNPCRACRGAGVCP